MSNMHLVVDGMLSGTGLRDKHGGGYVEPDEIGIPKVICSSIQSWLNKYEEAHYQGFSDRDENEILDSDGLEIARKLKALFPDWKIEYFSNAYMAGIEVK